MILFCTVCAMMNGIFILFFFFRFEKKKIYINLTRSQSSLSRCGDKPRVRRATPVILVSCLQIVLLTVLAPKSNPILLFFAICNCHFSTKKTNIKTKKKKMYLHLYVLCIDGCATNT